MQNLIIINTDVFCNKWYQLIKNECLSLRLGLEEIERIYDLVIEDAFLAAAESDMLATRFNRARSNDWAYVVFKNLEYILLQDMRYVIEANGLIFHNFHKVKMLVTYDKLIICRSTHTGFPP